MNPAERENEREREKKIRNRMRDGKKALSFLSYLHWAFCSEQEIYAFEGGFLFVHLHSSARFVFSSMLV